MKENFSYPLNEDWNVQEITDVVDFFSLIEKAYESGVARTDMQKKYDLFLRVIPNKSEQKRIFREFRNNSGLEAYTVIKQLSNDVKRIRIDNV
ncbi:UPF0223 family protein [Pediococcus claussenii]|uniref:Uncharacterized protein n=1 Tax=Pediococcus claussenii (strain ATCC BAA-344 / DSM 14800 / JCM 18046 / KCTC 3811 / LMG 21948 / P06) TaxID=701521 RepID=G8PCX3_PEDCP|nr:UPF0223 family protein [Pediococcus claussenii]AEV95108.1 hypothetical protein PECL_835 [Pediococcus claussenii ATCC BAA-344]KRN18867.1 hypothetical protein IV79_GL000293 [Pediococcus claussenii]